jgi:pantoate--beta-alanine ligase
MVRDLAMGIQIVGGPLVRDSDGLALSSRNAYLSASDRLRGLTLHQALFAMADSQATSAKERMALGQSILQADTVDYLAIVDADSLEPLDEIDRPARALVAARIGGTRLIDNIALD